MTFYRTKAGYIGINWPLTLALAYMLYGMTRQTIYYELWRNADWLLFPLWQWLDPNYIPPV